MRLSPSRWPSATRPSPRAPASCSLWGALARCRTSTSGSTGRDRRATKPGIALGCSIPPRPAVAASATWGRRDAILTMKDGIMKLATPQGDDTLPSANVPAPAFTALRDALDHWRRGAAPPISVHDCARVVRLIDQAYERAG